MDFFASQDLARRKTKWLVFYLIVALVLMIVAVYLVILAGLGFARASDRSGLPAAGAAQLFHPLLLISVAAGVTTVVAAGSFYKTMELKQGGATVAALLGGRRVPTTATSAAERRVLNVVEEMALASGVPVPPVYVLHDEEGINAFAAGFSTDDAVIGVNRGTVETLNRDELQGVIAHEFSHILNGDMRMSLYLIGILHGIQVLGLVGYFLMRTSGRSSQSSSSKKGGNPLPLIGLGIWLIGSIGLFFARLIKAQISQQREYLADASAVQFTRNPEGIAGALKMIAANAAGSRMKAANAEVASHMYFGSMFSSSYFNLMFATHPPLNERITRLDPRFQGDVGGYLKSRAKAAPVMAEQPSRAAAPPATATPRTPWDAMFPGGTFPGRFPIQPAALIAAIGDPQSDDVSYVQMLLGRVPQSLLEDVREVFTARCFVFASLLSSKPTMRRVQQELILAQEGQPSWESTERIERLLSRSDRRHRLPLFEIVQGTLHAFSLEQYQHFRTTVKKLVEADRQVDLFEFFLWHHLIVHLDRGFGRRREPAHRLRITDLRGDIAQLLSVLVKVGHQEPDAAREAFAAALAHVDARWEVASHQELLTTDWTIGALSQAIKRLGAAQPQIKKTVLSAASIAVTHDQQITIEEAELFRAFAESLDCPVPPMLATRL